MKKLLLIVCVIFLGCGGAKIRPDQSIPSISANYPSAEFYACGKRHVGIGTCMVNEGDEFSDLGFLIQGFYKGRIRVRSQTLPADVSLVYEGSRRINPGLAGPVMKDLVVQFVINPELPNEDRNDIEIHGAMGFLYVKAKKPGEEWDQVVTRTPTRTNAVRYFDTTLAEEVYVEAAECGVSKRFNVAGIDQFELLLSDLVDTASRGRCAFQIAVLGPAQRELISWVSFRYLNEYRALSEPAVEIDGDEIEIHGEEGVTVVAVDDKYKIDKEADFDWDPSTCHVIRLATVKGRLIVGTQCPGGQLKWKN